MANIKRFLSFSVTVVFLLMCLVYYATIFVFIEDCMSLKGYYGMLNALIFSLLAMMCFVSFISSVVLDPGYVPPSYVPEIEDSSASDPAVKRNGANSRYCEKCATHKPPRAHHCRICKRCLLRMDHHCTWINNCVGFSNYKPFIIFLLYAAISSSYSLVVIVVAILQKDWGFHGQTRLKIFYAICGSIMTMLSVTLGTLLIWHIYLLMHNMTTIEYHEGKRAEWLARKSGQSYRHPFDLGVLKNIILILGTNILGWPCPTAVGHLKDGTNFPTSHSS